MDARTEDIPPREEQLEYYHEKVANTYLEVGKVIQGLENEHGQMRQAMESAILALVVGKHVLYEGFPGLAKSRAMNALARVLDLTRGYIQGHPDLTSEDIVGRDLLAEEGDRTRGGLKFFDGVALRVNLYMIDEINRASSYALSAMNDLMMWGYHVTSHGETIRVPDVFTIVATMNPEDSAGTFTIPDTIYDRMLLREKFTYPDEETEYAIIHNSKRILELDELKPQLSVEDILSMRRFLDEHYHAAPDSAMSRYVMRVCRATRPQHSDEFAGMDELRDVVQSVERGASPRAADLLKQTATAYALLHKADKLAPQHVAAVAERVLAHRIIMHPSSKCTPEEVVRVILRSIKDPIVSDEGGLVCP